MDSKHKILAIAAACVVAACLRVAGANPADASALRCAAAIDAQIQCILFDQHPDGVAEQADTLQALLSPGSQPLSAEAWRRATLARQAYLIAADNPDVDYAAAAKAVVEPGDATPSMVLCAPFAGMWMTQQGHDDEAVACYERCYAGAAQLWPGTTLALADQAMIQAFEHHVKTRQWQKAADLGRSLLQTALTMPDDHPQRWLRRQAYALCLSQIGRTWESANMYLEAAREMARAGEPAEAVCQALLNCGNAAAEVDTPQAMAMAVDAYTRMEQLAKDLPEQQCQALAALASFYNDRMLYAEQLQTATRLVDLVEHCGAPAPMVRSLTHIDINPADDALLPRIAAMFVPIADLNDTDDLASLTTLYVSMGQTADALRCVERLDSLVHAMPPAGRLEARDAMLTAHMQVGDYDHAYMMARHLLDQAHTVGGNDSRLYAQILEAMSGLCALTGDYAKGMKYFNAAERIYRRDPSMGRQLAFKRASICSQMGDYDNVRLLLEPMTADTVPPADRLRALAMLSSALLYELNIRAGHSDAQPAATEAMGRQLLGLSRQGASLSERLYGPGHPRQLMATISQAGAYYFLGDTVGMMRAAGEAQALIDKYITNPKLRTLYTMNLAPCYIKVGRYADGLRFLEAHGTRYADFEAQEAFDLLRASALLKSGRAAEAQDMMRTVTRAVVGKVSRQMPALTNRERMYYWRKFSSNIDHAVKFIDQPDCDYAGDIYDLALYSKGLLLTSDREFAAAVKRTGRKELARKMRRMQQLREKALQSPSMPQAERDGLLQYADSIEKELLAVVAVEPSAAPTSWRSVLAALPPRAAAVEMIHYCDEQMTPRYGALVLTAEKGRPVFQDIGSLHDIDSLLRHQDYGAAGLQIWAPVMALADGCTDIYFAPIGAMHNAPIESFGMPEMAGCRVYRLSSTRSLLGRKVAPDVIHAVVYGGIDYDDTAASAATDEEASEAEHLRGASHRLRYLAGTKAEADAIARSMPGAQVTLLSGRDGTEASLRQLSGSDVTVLHIGTHGYYQVSPAGMLSAMLASTGPELFNAEDQALMRSALFFSGANLALRGEGGDYANDGIVTSMDIASMDLTHLDLVTLSACQTAQGDVTTDGVYGLQRGFKKAGANSLLMSLWQVDDEATRMLMSDFYSQLQAGAGKHQALEHAKAAVRSVAAYDHPRYWAAFILLDGID